MIEFAHGALAPRYEDQANKHGYTLGDKKEYFDIVATCYNCLNFNGLLTDRVADSICTKIQKQLVKNLKPI